MLDLLLRGLDVGHRRLAPLEKLGENLGGDLVAGVPGDDDVRPLGVHGPIFKGVVGVEDAFVVVPRPFGVGVAALGLDVVKLQPRGDEFEVPTLLFGVSVEGVGEFRVAPPPEMDGLVLILLDGGHVEAAREMERVHDVADRGDWG